VSLDAGTNQTVTFESLSVAQTGTFTHGVFTANDSATANITVEEPPLSDGVPGVPGSDLPTDPLPGSGREDVNGDGNADFDDVIDLFFALDRLSDASPEQVAAVDYDGDGDADFDDIVELLFRL
jgi:hypothetical protein